MTLIFPFSRLTCQFLHLIPYFQSYSSNSQIGLIPEEPEDMWHAYNLVAAGDSLRSTTVRKVTMESSTGSSTSNRVRTTLTISVEDLDFDVQAGVLRVKGRNIAENPYVKV